MAYQPMLVDGRIWTVSITGADPDPIPETEHSKQIIYYKVQGDSVTETENYKKVYISYNKKEDYVSKKSLFKTLLYKILQVFVGLFLTNVLWIIPFGFIICIGIIINGVIGAGKALKALLQFNAGGK
jgi:hypothetical protein